MTDDAATMIPTAAATIKQGHVSVRGHFMWRDRFVVVEVGSVTILRSNKGSVKAKIDLLDVSTRVVFHEDDTQLSIFTQSHHTAFNCSSTYERDAWVSALFTAKGGHGGDTDCETSDLVLSSMEEYDKEKPTVQQDASERERDHAPSVDDDDTTEQECDDTLQAFRDLRSSMMQCHMSLIGSQADDENEDEDGSLRSSQRERWSAVSPQRLSSDEDALKKRNLNAIVAFIQTLQHGGRAVLLHLDVVTATCGISLEEILRAIGERQRDKQQHTQRSTAATGLQKLHVATFVRYILFHPVYSKRFEVTQDADKIDALVDRYFPHCRLRRFSHDIEQGSSVHAFELDVSWQCKESNDATATLTRPAHMARIAPLSMPKPDLAALKKKRHSFPNILLPLQIGPLHVQPSLSRLECSATTPLNAKRSCSDHLIDHGTTSTAAAEQDDMAKNDINSDLFQDEVVPDPLRNVLWKFTCQQIAEQLSIFHQKQLSILTLWEFVHAPKQSAKAITDHFNRLVSYLVWSVLVEDSAKDRAETIESIVTIATIASAPPLSNFHLVMACVGCLGDLPLMLSRLPATWKRVRSKFKTQLVALRTLCDHTGGFEALRKRQATDSSKGSCIPFIGVIGVTLERLRLAPYLNTSNKPGMLDLDKVDRQYVAVSTIESAMLRPYKFHETVELQQWALSKIAIMDAFASPRLLQLRSQQLLAFETQQSGSRTSSMYRSRHSPGSSGGSDCSTEGGRPLLPFYEICSLLVSTKDVSERVQISIEALLADARQPLTARLRRFHQDFKQSACHSASHVVLAGVRSCADTLKRELIAQKSFEIMQLTGLDDTSIQLERAVYASAHLAVTRPIATWLFTKARHAFVDEDKRILELVLASIDGRDWEARRPRCASYDKSSQTPLDLLMALVELFQDIPSEATSAVRLQHCRQIIVSWTRTPFTVLVLLQQSLDVLFLSRELREALELFDSAVSTLEKRPSTRALLSSSLAQLGASSKSLSVQPAERIY